MCVPTKSAGYAHPEALLQVANKSKSVRRVATSVFGFIDFIVSKEQDEHFEHWFNLTFRQAQKSAARYLRRSTGR